jgi:hypothetical protein
MASRVQMAIPGLPRAEISVVRLAIGEAVKRAPAEIIRRAQSANSRRRIDPEKNFGI